MSGVFTPGLPAPTTANVILPLGSGGLSIPADTNAASGGGPESVAVNTNIGLLASLGNLSAAALSGSNITVDASLGSAQTVSINGSAYALRVINLSPGQLLELYVTTTAAGPSTISTYKNGYGPNQSTSTASDASVVWPAKTAPTLSTTQSSVDVLTFRMGGSGSAGVARGGSVLNVG